MWLKVWTICGLVGFALAITPKLFVWPRVLIPAAVFGSSVAALVAWGHLH